jgi:hypothetical protein
VYEAAVDRRSRASGARSAEPKWGAGYAVYDPVSQKVGSAEQVFVSQDGEPVYIRVRIGRLWTRTVLIPVQFVDTDDEGKNPRLEVGVTCIPQELK